MMLLLNCGVITFGLPRNSWQLLLRLTDSNSARKSRLWRLTSSRSSTTSEPYFLVLLLTMLNVQFWLWRLDCFLTCSFIWNVSTLFFLFFSRLVTNLQMSINKSGCELILSNGCCQKFRNTSRKEVFFEDLAHRWTSVWILDKHISKKILKVLRVVWWDLWIATPQNFKHQSLHAISIEGVPQSNHFVKNTT